MGGGLSRVGGLKKYLPPPQSSHRLLNRSTLDLTASTDASFVLDFIFLCVITWQSWHKLRKLLMSNISLSISSTLFALSQGFTW